MNLKYLQLFEDWEAPEDWNTPDDADIAASGIQPEWLNYIDQYITGGCKGDLELHKWRHEITHIPERLKKIGGSLELDNCSKLESLPPDLLVIGYIHIRYCSRLKNLPKGIRSIGNIVIKNCLNFEYLSDNTQAYDLTITGCPKFKLDIPNKLQITNRFIVEFPNTPNIDSLFKTRIIKPELVKQEILQKLGSVDNVILARF